MARKRKVIIKPKFSVFADVAFKTGNLKNITMKNYHLYDILESDYDDCDYRLEQFRKNKTLLTSMSGKYIIERFEIKDIELV